MGCSRKNSHPHSERQLENLMEVGRGVNGSENPDGRGALNLKIQPREVTFDFIDVSIASINPFSTIVALHFQILLFFQITDLLPHLF